MRGKYSLSTFALSLALALSLSLPVRASDGQTTKPLSEKENPLLIGQRDLNKGQIDFYSLEREVKLGAQLAAETNRELKFVDDPIVNEFINRIGQNIALNSDAKVPFTIKVVDSPDVNAFALPGGFFYVNAGLILAAETEAQLAGVMAHEIAHVAARHGVEQASKGQLLQYASIPLIFLGGLPATIIQNAAGLLVPLTFLKFSRGAEEEADRLGAQYAWKTGYDPNEIINFFEKLQAQEKKKPGTISKLFMSHPTTDKRIVQVRDLVSRFPEQKEYTVNTAEFSRIKEQLQQVSKVKFTDTDPNRPTLKRRKAKDTAGDAEPDSVQTEETAAPDRPRLKRNFTAGR